MPIPADDPRIPVVVLTGFLGSGKTTLLRRLLVDPRVSRTAVLINEFGEIALDHLLVKSVVDGAVVSRMDVSVARCGPTCATASAASSTLVTPANFPSSTASSSKRPGSQIRRRLHRRC
jgi:hypothetical protein